MSLHDIALSLQRKIRSDFPLYMLNESTFNIESFLAQCYSGRTKDILETSKSLKKDLENLLESTEKTLSQKISQEFDRLITIPTTMINLESDISDLYNQSHSLSTTLKQVNSNTENLILSITEKVQIQKQIDEEKLLEKEQELIESYLVEIHEKLLTYKNCANLPKEKKILVEYSSVGERISKLISYCEDLSKSKANFDLSRVKTYFLSLLQKELIFWSSHTCTTHFEALLECYSNLKLESEAQLILRDSIALPVIKGFMPVQMSPIDEGFSLEDFFAKVLNEVTTGKLKFFIDYSDKCDILVKSFWKASIKVLLSKSKMFSPVFSQDYKFSLVTSIEFSERVASYLPDPKTFRNSQDFMDFIEKWNLPTFFELKKNEIIKPLLPILKSEYLADFLLLEPSNVYSAALNQCIESTLIPELYSKFLRLIFQITSTYCNFVTRKLNSETKAKGVIADTLVRLIKDITNFKSSLSPKLPSAAISEIEISLQQLLDPCVRGITESISKTCISNLESIKSIPSLYQMTGRDMPSRPSLFVSNIFQPIKLISLDIIPKEKIINKVLITFTEIIQETKQEILRVGELISKYHPDSTDTKKMEKQLEIDRDELVKVLGNLGFTSENNEVIRQLLS